MHIYPFCCFSKFIVFIFVSVSIEWIFWQRYESQSPFYPCWLMPQTPVSGRKAVCVQKSQVCARFPHQHSPFTRDLHHSRSSVKASGRLDAPRFPSLNPDGGLGACVLPRITAIRHSYSASFTVLSSFKAIATACLST